MFNVTARHLPFAAAAALAAAMAAVTPAAAQEREASSKAVRYADLDLSTEQGAASLNRRVHSAARDVCGRPDIRDLKAHAAAQSCYATAIERADPQVQLAVEAARNGQQMAQNSVSVRAAH